MSEARTRGALSAIDQGPRHVHTVHRTVFSMSTPTQLGFQFRQTSRFQRLRTNAS
jgi:hypothetical protein